MQSAVDEAAEKLTEATARSERLRFELAALEDERTRQKESVEIALARLHESDAAMAAVAEQLAQLGSLAKASRGEAQRMADAIAAAEAERDRNLSGLADLEQRLSDVEQYGDEEGGDEPDTTERDRLAEAAKAGRAGEMEARLALRTTEERARALSGRADSLERAARQEREARARAIARAARRARQSRPRRPCTWPPATYWPGWSTRCSWPRRSGRRSRPSGPTASRRWPRPVRRPGT